MKTLKEFHNSIFSLRFIASLTAFFILTYQILPTTSYASIAQEIPTNAQSLPGEIDPSEVKSDEVSSDFSFLNDFLYVDALDQVEEEDRYDGARYELEDALSNLEQEDVAQVAVVNFDAGIDWQKIVKHNNELAFAVIGKQLVLFNSGQTGEVRLHPIADAFLKYLKDQKDDEGNNVLTALGHIHLEGMSPNAGTKDKERAAELGLNYEIVVGENGYVEYYNGEESLEVTNYNSLNVKLASLIDQNKSSKQTREYLSAFIQAVDQYNEDPDNYVVRFSQPVTILPNNPNSFAFSSAGTGLTHTRLPNPDGSNSGDSRVSVSRLDYSTIAGGFGGVSYEYGAAGADFSGILANATDKISFDLRTDNLTLSDCPTAASQSICTKVEIEDTLGNRANILLSDLTATFKQFDITKAQIQAANAAIDFTKIKKIVFVVEHTRVSGNNNGFLEIKVGGIFPPVIANDATKAAVDVTHLPVNSNGVNVTVGSFAGNGATVDLSTPTSELLQLDYTGGSTGFSGVSYNYDDPATAGTVETIDMTAANFPNGITLGADVAVNALSSFKLELVDNTNAKVTVLFTGLNSTRQYFHISAANLLNIANDQGLDLTKVKFLNVVLEGSATNAIFTLELGNHASQPVLTPDVTDPAITQLPVTSNGERATLTALASADVPTPSTASVQVFSQTFAEINGVGQAANSFTGGFVSFDDGSTGAIESLDLTTVDPTDIVARFISPDNTVPEFVLEFTDVTGKKDSVLISGITNAGQKFKLPIALLNEIDTTKVTTISFVILGAGAKKLQIDWGLFRFIPALAPNPAAGAVTFLPNTSVGERVEAFSFASASSTATVTPLSATFLQLATNNVGTNPFAGMFLNFDDGNTAGTVESIDWTALFPTGAVFNVTRPTGTATTLRMGITDATGKTDEIDLTELDTVGKKFQVTAALFDEVDMTKVRTISFFSTDAGGNVFQIDWGLFKFIPQIAPDGTTPAITPLPLNSSNNRVAVNGFVTADGSVINANVPNKDTVNATYTGAADTSTGGFFVSYDDGSTAGTIETIDVTALYPGGMVVELQSANVTEVVVEFEDINGQKDEVKLTGIDNTPGKRWKIDFNLIDEIDKTKIKTIAYVFSGSGTKNLTLRQGPFAFVPAVGPDATNPAVTPLPQNSQGNNPVLTPFARETFPAGNPDDSFVTVDATSQNTANAVFTLFGDISFGGLFVDYDDPSTAGVTETINLDALFGATGIVLNLDSPAAGITSILLELTDASGKTDRINLTGITAVTQAYKILVSQFDEIDTTQVKTITLLLDNDFVGQTHINQQLNVGWGVWNTRLKAAADPTNPAITPLPNNSLGKRVTPTSFQTNDFSLVTTNVTSPTTMDINFKLWNPASFGGTLLNFDDGSTGAKEFIDFGATFPTGLVAKFASADLTEVILEVTDVNGKTDKVRIQGIETTAKTWKILPSQFEEVDITKIVSIGFLLEGRNVDKNLSVELGNWDFNQTVVADGVVNAPTPLPATSTGDLVTPTSFQTNDFSLVTTNVTSPTTLDINWKLWNPTSFGGTSFNFDNGNTGAIESIDFTTVFPAGLILKLASANMTEVILEILDANGKTDRITLSGIEATAKSWTVLAAAFEEVDMTKVVAINFIKEGVNVDVDLNVELGNWTFNQMIAADGVVNAPTPLPATSTGDLVTPTSFQTDDFSLVTTNVTSPTTLNVNWKLWNPTSFGGTAFNFDNGNTGAIESIDYTTTFPTGLVLKLASADITDVILEVLDANGKTDRVTLTGIEATAKSWTIPAAAFQEVDMTKVVSLVLLKEGRNVDVNLSVELGNWTFNQTVAADGVVNAPTPLPATSTGDLVTPTSFQTNDFSLVTTNVTSPTTLDINWKLWNPTSFGGTSFNFDNGNTGAIESIDFTTVFPAGLILKLASANMTEVILEILDANGKTDRITLSGIEATAKSWTVLAAAFEEVDMTKVVAINFIKEGVNVDVDLNVELGNWTFNQMIAADGVVNAPTPFPATSTGDLVTPTSFQTNDFSLVTTNVTSPTTLNVNWKLWNPTSFGGTAFNFDNGSTGAIESIDYTTTFPTGLVLKLASADITDVILEVLDANGKTDRVTLTGIEATAKSWTIPAAAFQEVDMTKVVSLVLLKEGRNVDVNLSVELGNWTFNQTVVADPIAKAATPLPFTSTGARVQAGIVVSNDFSDVDLSIPSQTTLAATFNLFNPTSFGAVTFGYGTTNPIDFTTTFPTGLVLKLDSPSLTQVTLELADSTGKTDRITLTGIEATAKSWTVLANMFQEIDMTKIASFVFLLEGVNVNKVLNIELGNWVPEVGPDATNPAIVKLPATSSGGFAPWTEFVSNDFSQVISNESSTTKTKFEFNLFNQTSFGGAFLDYGATGINFAALFPAGVVFSLDNGGTSITEAFFEVTDTAGVKRRVKLEGITGTAQKFKIALALLAGIDLTKVQVISFVVEGQHFPSELNLEWGDHEFIPVGGGGAGGP